MVQTTVQMAQTTVTSARLLYGHARTVVCALALIDTLRQATAAHVHALTVHPSCQRY